MRATRTVYVAALLLGCLAGTAAADATIEFSILGTGPIPLVSYQLGASQSGGTGFGPTGKRIVTPEFSSVAVTRFVDQYSPLLLQGLVGGGPLGTATIRIPDEVGTTTVMLGDVLVASYALSGSGGGSPTESLTLAFTRIEYDSGGKKFCYDLRLRKAC